jgi:uncharacterized repeat protein (TIGR01451 family)
MDAATAQMAFFGPRRHQCGQDGCRPALFLIAPDRPGVLFDRSADRLQPGLAILKTVSSVTDVNGDHLVDAGDVIHYKIHVANAGNVTLTGLTVTYPLTGNPAGIMSTAGGWPLGRPRGQLRHHTDRRGQPRRQRLRLHRRQPDP